jgi:hypothetical protein
MKTPTAYFQIKVWIRDRIDIIGTAFILVVFLASVTKAIEAQHIELLVLSILLLIFTAAIFLTGERSK